MLPQPFPTTRPLRGNLDLSWASLASRIADEAGDIYAYIMTTVVLGEDEFQQIGCGPNFQGGLLTLCTCKHRMRASLSCEEWKDKWVAGFTSLRCNHRHWLFYLACVEAAFASHSELWHSEALTPKARQEKSASKSPLGDLYRPNGELHSAARFDPCQYHRPVRGHVHFADDLDNRWRIDINYRSKPLKLKAKQPAALLVCNPQCSFVWRKPLLYVDGKWRQRNYRSAKELLKDLNVARDEHHDETGRATAGRC
jgi:hypothetical protein